jgi:hypothetical protein
VSPNAITLVGLSIMLGFLAFSYLATGGGTQLLPDAAAGTAAGAATDASEAPVPREGMDVAAFAASTASVPLIPPEHVHTHAPVHVHTHAPIHVHTHAPVHMHTRTRTHTHTHTHIHRTSAPAALVPSVASAWASASRRLSAWWARCVAAEGGPGRLLRTCLEAAGLAGGPGDSYLAAWWAGLSALGTGSGSGEGKASLFSVLSTASPWSRLASALAALWDTAAAAVAQLWASVTAFAAACLHTASAAVSRAAAAASWFADASGLSALVRWGPLAWGRDAAEWAAEVVRELWLLARLGATGARWTWALLSWANAAVEKAQAGLALVGAAFSALAAPLADRAGWLLAGAGGLAGSVWDGVVSSAPAAAALAWTESLPAWSPGPSTWLALMGAAVLAYFACDALDGMQGRKVGQYDQVRLRCAISARCAM